MELASGSTKIAQIQSRHLYLFSLRRYVNEADIVTFPLRRSDPHKATKTMNASKAKHTKHNKAQKAMQNKQGKNRGTRCCCNMMPNVCANRTWPAHAAATCRERKLNEHVTDKLLFEGCNDVLLGTIACRPQG